ncbi:general secretion pathway protein GspL [Halioglobus maricola]|uniref:General secretion pathway protein GspL n=1 Tax=Halioglobus maricola TaxID=2601894 RepID=A0A5P9NMI5_9GAMM|nr:PilN domain-containing protein [Halioglobus maricola]QFU76705.1 general secretion pathway protein GspL [Halioglobus maricola]
MFESQQNWELFGYDMRDLGRHFTAAWRDFLWAYDSPVRARLDEPVRLQSMDGVACYQAGELCTGTGADCAAVLLPEDLVLSRLLRLPLAVESDLPAVVALEVNANSPFSADDTGYGWRVIERGEQQLKVVLVIVSRSAAMTYVAQEYGSHDPLAQELWVDSEGAKVVVEGFGEGQRRERYKRRLVRVASMLGGAALVVLVAIAASAGLKKVELGNVEEIAQRTQMETAEASRMRAELSQANEAIAEINTLQQDHPSPHLELARLTSLLSDDAFIERFSMSGTEIDLRGRATDASSLMQVLTEQADYGRVSAASPIRRVPGQDKEQFHLKITMGEPG